METDGHLVAFLLFECVTKPTHFSNLRHAQTFDRERLSPRSPSPGLESAIYSCIDKL